MIAFLSIGSNLGNRWHNVDAALVQLQGNGGIEIDDLSAVYETAPFGDVPQGPFLNLVVAIRTELSAAELLKTVLAIEILLGRIRDVRWGPRVIDIDILAYGALIFRSPNLILPHPGVCERRFVLMPWCEIAPNYTVPVAQKTVSQLLEICPDDGVVNWLG